MIRYQFRPSLVDHCQISVLVRPFFSASDHDLNAVISKLSKFQFAKVQNDNKRIVRFKFHRGFPREHMDWGKLQIHRRQIGLLAIARLSNDPSQHAKDMEKIQHRFGNIKMQYESAIFDARCIVLCSEKPQVQPSQSVIFLEDKNDGEAEHFAEFMHDFMSSLFVILESKRVEKGNEKLEKMELPTAPIEQEQTISDSDTRIMKRKCLGRNRKLLADWCLLSGMYQDALYHYGHSSEHLRSVSDLLWMGAALEGLCATSIIMTKIEVPFVDSKLILKGSGNSNLSQGDLNPEEDKSKIYVPLTDDEILSRYCEVLSCYGKFQTAHIEMEAHLKFAKMLLSMKRVLDACGIIQDLLTLKLGYNDTEKVDLCKVISTMFDQVNLKRKAAFFRRRAAMHCYNQNNASQAALKFANVSLLKTTDALMLNLKTHDRPKNSSQNGWPFLQLLVLLDMLQVSTRLGDTMNCIRLLCYILENYSSMLIDTKKFELINRLEDCSSEVEDQQKLNGIEQIEMIRSLPIVRDFKPRPLANHLQPKKQKSEIEHCGPFIFSSLSFQAKKKKTEKEVIWVCGDVAEVGMTVDNPLPAEIKVKKMILVTEGIHFEAFPATLALPAESGSFPFMLLGTPQTAGTLVIKGYKVDVFGIENTVMLKNPISVQVAPSLPLVNLHCSLQVAPSQYHPNPDDEDYQTLFASLSTYKGHSTQTKLTVENVGKLTINSMSIKLKKATDKAIAFDEESWKSILPLDPGKSADIDLLIMPEDAWKAPPNVDNIKSSLTLSYTNQEDDSNGYGREIAFVIDVKMMASLSIESYEVYEITKHPSCCCLCFDVHNHASIDMNFEVFIKETKDIKPKDGCPIQTVTLLPAKSHKRVGIHFPRCLVEVPNLRLKERVENAYSKAIKDAIEVKWTLCNSQFNGVMYLTNLKCTLEMVNVFKPRHLGMNVGIDNKTLNEGEDISTSVCQMINLHVQLTNDLDFDQNESNCLRDLNLCIQPHQGDDIDIPSSQTLFAHFGTLRKNIKKLSPGEVLDHSCGLFFLFPGEYVVDITCKMNAFSSRMSIKRDRALAVINDTSGIDTTDKGCDEIQVLTDGTVAQMRRDSQPKGNILQRPSLNNWARRFLVHVA